MQLPTDNGLFVWWNKLNDLSPSKLDSDPYRLNFLCYFCFESKSKFLEITDRYRGGSRILSGGGGGGGECSKIVYLSLGRPNHLSEHSQNAIKYLYAYFAP